MSYWQIITPSEATNLITNPSIETATTGWTAVGASIARSATYQKWGVYALKVTPTAALADGAYFGTVTLVAGYTYTFSAWVRGAAGVTYTLYFADTSGNALGTPVTFTGTGSFVRVQATYAEGVNTTRRLYITKSAHASTADFYIDGAVCEAAAAATTYVDGEQEGCVWLGTAHASQSKRDMMNRAGGTISDLADLFAYVTKPVGGGMSRIQNVITPYGILDGGSYQRSVARSRVFQLGVRLESTSLQGLHGARNDLLALFEPDRVAVQQPLRIRYTGGAEPVLLSAVYESGAEAQGDTGYGEDMILRFACDDPYWYGEGDAAGVLDVHDSLARSFVVQRSPTGVWSALAATASVNDAVMALMRARNGNLIAGGDFTVIGALTTTAIAEWDGVAWNALGSGAASGYVNDMAFDASGNLYVVGSFLNMGGVAAADYLAKWDGSTWTSITPTPADGEIRAIEFDAAGNLFVTGDFSNINGVAAAYIAKWDGSTWTACGAGLGAGLTITRGYSLARGPDGTITVGGDFTTADGVTVGGVARWNGTTFVALAAGVAGIVNALAFAPDGTLYLGGTFLNAGGVASADYIARWNGKAFSPVGGGLNDKCYDLQWDAARDYLIASGNFTTTADGVALNRIGQWTGSQWEPIDYAPNHNPASNKTTTHTAPDGTFTIGRNSSAAHDAAGITVVSNTGTARAYPVLKISGPGALWSITNYSTLKSLWFSGLTLISGETLTIDLRPGKKTITSDVRGNLISKLVGGSHLAEWCLLAGNNSVSVFCDDASASGTIQFAPRYWSSDGAS